MRTPLRQPLPHLNDSAHPIQQVPSTDARSSVLVRKFQNTVDDLVFGFGQEVRLGEGSGEKPLRSRSSTIAAVSHMFEIVAFSRDMVSRLERSILIIASVPSLLHRQT